MTDYKKMFDALVWIANVNATDFEYVKVARAALKSLEGQGDPTFDAVRYRYVRANARAFSVDISGKHTWAVQLRRECRGSTLDEAIDAALAVEKSRDQGATS